VLRFLLSAEKVIIKSVFLCEGTVMQVKYTKEYCISLLCEMQKKLESEGESRYPKRSDFSEEETAAIKSYLGPWPRALEAAGLKEINQAVVAAAERRLEKRIIKKRNNTLMKKNANKSNDVESEANINETKKKEE